MNLNPLSLSLTLGATLSLACLPAYAAVPIGSDHVDIGIAYEGGAFDLHIHQEEPVDIEYAPDEAFFLIGAVSQTTSPGGPFTAFLGSAGNPVWVLPATEVAGLPFLGFGTEELDPADWLGNLSLSLRSVTGTGNFSVWSSGAFGVPTVAMNSTDGFSEGDRLSLVPGSHGHYNLGFTAPGTYVVELEASGTHVVDGPVSSGPTAYTFQVVPEPSTYVLLLAGTGAFLVSRRWLR
jgi:surface-anchored protein